MQHRGISLSCLAAIMFVTGVCGAAGQSEPLAGAAAFGDWRADKPGLVRIIRPEDLPRPGATPSAANFSPSRADGVQLSVNAISRVDLHLTLAAVNANLRVEAVAPLIETETSEEGLVVAGVMVLIGWTIMRSMGRIEV